MDIEDSYRYWDRDLGKIASYPKPLIMGTAHTGQRVLFSLNPELYSGEWRLTKHIPPCLVFHGSHIIIITVFRQSQAIVMEYVIRKTAISTESILSRKHASASLQDKQWTLKSNLIRHSLKDIRSTDSYFRQTQFLLNKVFFYLIKIQKDWFQLKYKISSSWN